LPSLKRIHVQTGSCELLPRSIGNAFQFFVDVRLVHPFGGFRKSISCEHGFNHQRLMPRERLIRMVRSSIPAILVLSVRIATGQRSQPGTETQSRRTLAPIRGGAIKLTPYEHVTNCLGVGEGIETTLSMRLLPEFGASPVWSLLTAGNLASLPALPGIECLWVAVDHDPAGIEAAHETAARFDSLLAGTARQTRSNGAE
jgi:hypothetical protein